MTLDDVYLYNPESNKFVKELRPNTSDVTKTDNCKFTNFNLSRELLKAIYSAGFIYPSPIQKEAIPVILSGKHVLARAKNGTGKTAAFAIPVMQLVQKQLPFLQALVIVPSRELAEQTNEVFQKLNVDGSIKIILSMGGILLKENIREFKDNCQIMVGTPGRIQHLVEIDSSIFKNCQLVVIDEADMLLSSHFFESIKIIHNATPETRQILLFSATFPTSIEEFSNALMKGAVKISTMECLTLKGVTPFYVYLDESEKLKCLWYLINKLNINQSIIFVNTIDRAELLHSQMLKQGYNCICIHSQMDQRVRSEIYHSFKSGKYRHLVSTNLFTRGIDIATVNVVVNFDFPTSVDTYLHRIGRSGRFGQVGLSVEMVTDKEKVSFYNVENYLDIDIKQLPEEVDPKLYN